MEHLIDYPGSRYDLLDGEAEIRPNVYVVPTPGPVNGHQSLVVECEDGSVVPAGQSHDTASEWNADVLAASAARLGHEEPLPVAPAWPERLLASIQSGSFLPMTPRFGGPPDSRPTHGFGGLAPSVVRSWAAPSVTLCGYLRMFTVCVSRPTPMRIWRIDQNASRVSIRSVPWPTRGVRSATTGDYD